MMSLESILKDLGIVTIIAGLITWLIQKLGESLIDKNQKSYELKLNNESERFKTELNQSLEKYKSELNLIFEKSSKLHDKRIERIEELYYMLNDFHNDMLVIVSWKIVTGMTNEQIQQQEFDNVKKAEASGNKFLLYYMRHKLYFSLETCTLIDEIIKLLKESHTDFSFKYIFGPVSAEMEYENVKKATEKIRTKVPEIKVKLEENFRKIIGVE
jgi:uncharacterized membrane-anchored protein YhcB (DUF1043 family)